MQAWRDGWYAQLKKQLELTESEEQVMHDASESTAGDYKSAQRVSTLLKRAKPAWDAGADEGLPAFYARYKWEYPWTVEFTAVPKDDDRRKHWKDLPTVTTLMEEMAVPTGEDKSTQQMPDLSTVAGLPENQKLQLLIPQKGQKKKHSQQTDDFDDELMTQNPGANTSSSSAGPAGKQAKKEGWKGDAQWQQWKGTTWKDYTKGDSQAEPQKTGKGKGADDDAQKGKTDHQNKPY